MNQRQHRVENEPNGILPATAILSNVPWVRWMVKNATRSCEPRNREKTRSTPDFPACETAMVRSRPKIVGQTRKLTRWVVKKLIPSNSHAPRPSSGPLKQCENRPLNPRRREEKGNSSAHAPWATLPPASRSRPRRLVTSPGTGCRRGSRRHGWPGSPDIPSDSFHMLCNRARFLDWQEEMVFKAVNLKRRWRVRRAEPAARSRSWPA